MPRPARNRRPTKAVNPAAMELGQLLALPRQTLVLLASARHLVTTGSKARLAERIHAFEHAIPPPPGPVADVGANSPTPTLLSVNVDQQPTPPTAFSEVQITQLRSLISAVVHSERVGTPALPVQVESSALSPATPQPPPPSRAIPTGTINSTNIATAAQDGVDSVGLTQTPGPSLSSTIVAATPGTSAPAHNLPPIPQKILQHIAKREYIDFADLLSDNLYPHPSLATQNQYKLELNPEDPSALAIVPSHQCKRRVDGLHSWLEAWNVYLQTVLHYFPLLAPDLLAYQDQICKFSRKFRASAWIMYDTAFRCMAASNPSMPWGKINDQLYNDILKEENTPFLHFVSFLRPPHHQLSPLVPRSTSPFVALQPKLNHLPPVQPPPQQAHLNHPSPPHWPPSQPLRLPSSAATSTVVFCRRVNCQFQHICSNQGCGGIHPSTQCLKGV